MAFFRRFGFINNIGFILLAIYLILTGIFSLIGGGNPIIEIILAILAIAAGIFILIGR